MASTALLIFSLVCDNIGMSCFGPPPSSSWGPTLAGIANSLIGYYRSFRAWHSINLAQRDASRKRFDASQLPSETGVLD